jgi:predicted negative regulator of RcsB-dependent stress response
VLLAILGILGIFGWARYDEWQTTHKEQAHKAADQQTETHGIDGSLAFRSVKLFC